MADDRWHNKASILRDLTEMGHVINAAEFEVIAGNNRPPRRRVVEEYNDIDYEFQQQFGDASTNHERVEPDLAGITRMIRMVNGYESGSHFDDQERFLERQAIQISKFNPNPSEFMPGGSNIQSAIDVEKQTLTDKMNKYGDNIKLMETEIEEKDRLLKKKIADNAKANTVAKKKEKNVAMAALLKLHSDPSIQKEETETTPYKLLSPGENPEAGLENVEQDLSVNLKKVAMSIKKVHNWFEGPEPTPGCSRPGPSRPGPSRPGPSWPETSRPDPSEPFLNIESILYKRKEISSTATDATPGTSQAASSASRHTIPSFVSTNTALYEKLLAGSKRVEEAELAAKAMANETVWEKATRLMKEREASAQPGEMKKKKKKKK